MYVLTFMSELCPPSIKVGYCSYKIDKYYPNPLRCGKCCRWGHSASSCRSGIVCSFCSQRGHSKETCQSPTPQCINCGEAHSSLSKTCRAYLTEKSICHTAVDMNVSFKDARRIMQSQSRQRIQGQEITYGSDNNGHFVNASKAPEPGCRTTFPQLQSQQCRVMDKNTPSRQQVFPQSQAWRAQQGNHSSQGSHWFTQQEARDHLQTQEWPNSNCTETRELDLPPLPTQTTDMQAEPTQNTNSQVLQSKSQTNASQSSTDVKQLIMRLLPLMIKLFLAEQATEKISCLLEVGEILKAESLVTSVISSIGLTSISSQDN